MIKRIYNTETNDYLNRDFEIGDMVTYKNGNRKVIGKIISFNEMYLTVDNNGIIETVSKTEAQKNILDYGYNPFSTKTQVQNIDFLVESIICMLSLDNHTPDENGFVENMYQNKNGMNVYKCNINPFVVINGETIYYQRDFVWEDWRKVKLIDTIYNYGSCGQVLIRDKSEDSDSSDIDTAWYEIVDGKQRILTLWEFINGKFADSNGKLFSDLSLRAQHKFLESLSFKVGKIKCTDEEVIQQFVIMNHGGKEQEKQHLDYLASKL
jgi:hypothetical protein